MATRVLILPVNTLQVGHVVELTVDAHPNGVMLSLGQQRKSVKDALGKIFGPAAVRVGLQLMHDREFFLDIHDVKLVAGTSHYLLLFELWDLSPI